VLYFLFGIPPRQCLIFLSVKHIEALEIGLPGQPVEFERSNGAFGVLPVSICTGWEDPCDVCNDSVMFDGNRAVFTFDSTM
jgi:hypothetical protein